jgi:hypothetical protein
MIDSLSSSIEHLRAGKLRALAVTSAARRGGLAGNNDDATYFLLGYEATGVGWCGRAKEHSIPEIVGELNREINAALAIRRSKRRSPSWAARYLLARPPTSASYGTE